MSDSSFEVILFVSGLVLVMVLGFFHVTSKLEVCAKYYPELTTTSCFFSDYGLPPARGSK